MESEKIDASAVRDADVLIVRTRTTVNESLLSGSSVRLVCTATIGFDHIDTAYCESHGIRWMSSPGCNAQAVCDYIEEALNESSFTLHHTPYTIGVVGVGYVGSLVAKMAARKGYEVLLNDPPKTIGVSLDFIGQKCDIITFHTPLDTSTYHLCDATFLSKCKPGALIINAARGGVVDELALLASGHPYILDTWENEPNIDPAVLDHALLASMHIAGYSVEGKRNASQMCLDAIAEQFNLPKIAITKSRNHEISIKKGDSAPGWLGRISDSLKKNPTAFESLRKAYPLREGSVQ
jgi:erythronate-4-phosphate dehydrogenase